MSAWWRLARKDLLVEARGKDTFTAMLVTALLVATVGVLAFRDAGEPAAVAAGVLWAGLVFAAGLGYGRAFLSEKDRGTWDALMALPVERGTLYLAKATGNATVTLVVAALALPTFLFLAGTPVTWAAAGLVAVTILLGGVGLAASGTILAALAAATRARETLLPVLLVPVTLPVLIAAVAATRRALEGAGWPDVQGSILLLAGYDLAFLAASWILFEIVVE